MEQIGAIAELIDALKKLPGVGPRAAQRIAYQLLNGDRSDANRLGEALLKATKTVHRCARCNNLTDGELCSFCASHNRDDSLLCIVESVADLMVIEQSLSYHGRYFILMGRLSPLNGVGPHEIGLDKNAPANPKLKKSSLRLLLPQKARRLPLPCRNFFPNTIPN